MSGLLLQEVTLHLGGRAVLDAATLAIPPGVVTAIIGPNGAGKSTLLAVAAGEHTPRRGDVLVGGVPARSVPARQLARRRVVMPQDTAVAFPFTVREVVEMGRTPWPRDAAADARLVDAALERVGITALADREVTALSGGERQLAAFARVIAQASPVGRETIVLLDEPTSAMDVAHAEASLGLMRELAAAGAAVGVVLHDLDAAAAFADRVAVVEHGSVTACGDVATVCTPERLGRAYGTPIEVFSHRGRLHVGPRRTARSRPHDATMGAWPSSTHPTASMPGPGHAIPVHPSVPSS